MEYSFGVLAVFLFSLFSASSGQSIAKSDIVLNTRPTKKKETHTSPYMG